VRFEDCGLLDYSDEYDMSLSKIDNATHEIGYDSVRFFATLLILIHHFNTTCSEVAIPFNRTISGFIDRFDMGGVGVGLFFILSGALQYKKNKERVCVKSYYGKRLLRIYIPYWIAFLEALLAVYITDREILDSITNNKIGTIISVLGLNYSSAFWTQIGIKPGILLVGEWFTAVIVFLYILFPLLHWIYKAHRRLGTIIIFLVFGINLKLEILTYFNGYFSITNGIMYFWLGMLFEEHREAMKPRWGIISWVVMVSVYIIKPYIFENNYLYCFIMSIVSFVYIYHLEMDFWVSRYICKYSYEIYLIHHRIFLIFMPMLLNSGSKQSQVFVCFVLLTGLILLLSEKLQAASRFATKVLFPDLFGAS